MAAESPPGGTSSDTSSETSTSTTEESFHSDAEPTPLRERPCTLGTRRPPAKRRMMQEESVVEASKTLLERITKTLAQLAPSGPGDVLAAHANVFEHRLRLLPPHQIRPFLINVENSFFEHFEKNQT